MSGVSYICGVSVLAVVLLSTVSVSDASSLLAVLNSTTTKVCPDKRQCPAGNTCCRSTDGGYGCCALDNAICCSDGQHCCPQNYYCESGGCAIDPFKVLEAQKLTTPVTDEKDKDSTPLQSLPSASTVKSNSEIVICPDPTRSCPDYSTCCLMPNHQWVCCPLPMAACCPDGFHCCPYGSRCDSTSTRCYRGDQEDSSALFFLQSILQRRNKNL